MKTLKGTALVAKAKRIATHAHAGQYRDDGVTPYITHPAEIVAAVGPNHTTCAVAWLHDVLEHTAVTADELRKARIPNSVIRDVERLSHLSDISYEDYLAVVKTEARTRKIKLADMKSNLAESTTKRELLKYANGIVFLLT